MIELIIKAVKNVHVYKKYKFISVIVLLNYLKFTITNFLNLNSLVIS